MSTATLESREAMACTRPASDRVVALRREYSSFLASLRLAAETERWVSGLFDRGLRLADEIESLTGPLAGRRVLEIGSAYAADLVALNARGAECIATDRFDFAYDRFRGRMPSLRGFDVVRCDAMSRWPFAGASFDVVMAMELVEMVEDLDGFFAEIARVLRPGGIAVLNTGVALKSIGRDPIYGLPLIAALPNRLRRFVAERIFRRGTGFRLSNHNFNSAGKFARHCRPVGYDVLPVKFAGSPVMRRAARWPLPGLWFRLIRWYAFDFVFIVPPRTNDAGATGMRAGCPRDR
jgi:SAM-dependent methyltransferase